ncbi:hypothetical protein D3C79_701400 [compost metagenome]
MDPPLGALHRGALVDGQVFVAHVGTDRLARPVQQGGIDGLRLGREAGQQLGAILRAQPAQDGHHLAPGNGLLQHAHYAAMQAQQQLACTLRRQGAEQGGPSRHRQGIEDAVELFRAQGQQLIGPLHRVQVVVEPALQGGEIEQLMTVEQGVCFLHHRYPHVISGRA